MKPKIFLLSLSVGVLSGTASAENGWSNLGGVLQQACSASQSGAAGMSFNTGRFGEKMQWLCQLQNIHGFIDSNILNGDWEAFAKDVAGKYIGQLANYVGNSMGDTGGINNMMTGLNDAMNKNYGDFKQALYGAAAKGYGPGTSLNAGFSDGSVGSITDQAIENNPTLSLANSVARVSDAMEAANGVQSAYKAKKIQDEAKKALESNTAQAINTATNVIGTPMKEGLVDKYTKDASSAVSAREVSEVLVQITGEAMKQDATMSVALLNQLGELAQQQVMTNTQLMLERQSREQDITRNEDELKAQVEQMVTENNAQTAEYQRDIKSAYSNMSSVLKAKINLQPVGE